MTSWAERMHRRAATFSNVVTSCGHPSVPYPRRLEKVKFGVPLDEVCKNDIPGPLLVLILKLNKEAPMKKDVFRAPGHQGNMKKLIHFLQAGRLVNMDNFSVYTIASVLKKFLRKLPGGIFGRSNEQQLFTIVQSGSAPEQCDQIHNLFASLPSHTQRLLVLLFGTFRVISTNADRARTGMTSEALGVSVAPSFFQSCVSDGKTAKMEDVLRYKVATRIMKFLIDNFGTYDLFGRTNYEFYARITGRILKVEDNWIFSFRFPPDTVSRPLPMETEKTWLQYECERWGLRFNLESMSHQEESQSTPALIHLPDSMDDAPGCSSLGMIPENNLLESCTRLSISLEENGLFKVHERQTARMRTRSEWFLNPPGRLSHSMDSDPTSVNVLRGSNTLSSSGNIGGLSASAESVSKRPSSIRRNSSRSRHGRSASRRNKENGSSKPPARPSSSGADVESGTQTFHVTLTYKPRI
ncbi:rho GTPase activating protein at 71E isoform X2 [Lycorma delicatula]|uniref:rho GTPase activating protein at 71E isoform X2 n=1 Tax=Lycorma delicatula TaxID=130591 RepID=UPI003F510FB7